MRRREFIARLMEAGAALGMGPVVAAELAALQRQHPQRRRREDPALAHHHPGGGFRNPWPTAVRDLDRFVERMRERLAAQLAPNPPPGMLPVEAPRIAYPRAAAHELRISWVGHATFLMQLGGFNLLTDPQWSARASPVQFAGPHRFVPPAVAWEALPPIDGVLLSHDHYDHLDDGTVRRLHRRYGHALRWFVPLGHRAWLAGRGVRNIAELDWWGEGTLGEGAGRLRIIALPCQHWTSRSLLDRQERLWSAWAAIAPAGRAVYFAGDTGYFPDFSEAPERLGSFDALMLPIGAYAPRWYMRPVHMNPEDAVQAYRELGDAGVMLPMHWGTWRLTDEPPLEPPLRARAAWAAAGLPEERLRVLPHGGTWVAG